MGLDVADHDVHTLASAHARGFEHRVRLADSGGGAKENRELAARGFCFLARHVRKQRIGVWATVDHLFTITESAQGVSTCNAGQLYGCRLGSRTAPAISGY